MWTVLLAPPRGPCAGVVEASVTVEPARERFDPPLDVRPEEVFFPFPPRLASVQRAGQRTSFSQKS